MTEPEKEGAGLVSGGGGGEGAGQIQGVKG